MVEKSIGRLILIVLVGIPLVISPGFFDNTYFVKAALLVILTCLIFIKWILYADDKKRKLTETRVSTHSWFGYYVITIVISTIFSVDPLNSLIGYRNRWEGIVIIFAYFLLFVFASLYFDFTEKRMSILLVIATVLSIISVVQIFGYLNFSQLYYPINDNIVRPYATLGNPNYLANLLTITVSISVYLYLKSNQIRYVFLAGMFYSIQLMTLTRGSWLGTVTSLCVLFVCFSKRKAWKQIITIIVVFFFLTIGLDLFLGGVIILRFFSIIMEFFNLTISKSPDIEGGSYRILLWSTALEAFPRHPLFGVGISNIGYIYEKYYPLVRATLDNVGVSTERVHNEVIQIAVTTGIFSLGFYLAGVGSIIRKLFHAIKTNIKLSLYLGVLLGYFVQSLFSSSVVSFSYYFWILMGAAIYDLREHASIRNLKYDESL